MKLLLFNHSNTFGGQEKFLELVAQKIRPLVREIIFLGSPQRLRSLNAAFITHPTTEPNYQNQSATIVIFNGNRALYKHALRLKRGEIWLYVQHSNFQDQQAGKLRPLIRKILLILLLRRVDLVIRVARNALPANLALGKVTTIYNGVDIAAYQCRSKWRMVQEQPIRLLMVGAVNSNKNQRMGIEVLAFLPRAELTIVGSGSVQAELELLARRLGVAKRVIWAGQQENTAPYYRNADILLMLSKYEAMPFVVLESMASGTPVVGFPVGGVPEVIENGVDGILIENKTPEALAKAIETLAEPALHRKMGERARKKIEQGFTADHMVNGLLQAIEKVRQARRMQGKA